MRRNKTAPQPVEGLAGLTATQILGAEGGRAASLRLVTPLSYAFTWFGSFAGIGIGSLMMDELAPPEVRNQLFLLVFAAVVGAAFFALSGRFLPENARYSVFRLGSVVALAIFAAIYVLGRDGVPVILVISIGFPLQVSHFLTRKDLTAFLAAWTVIASAAAAYAVSGPLTSAQVWPIFIAVVPITWIACAIFAHLSEARFSAIDQSAMLALRDSQTGLANRRGLADAGAAMLDVGSVAGLILIDLDDFKSANTLYGHAGGDRVIAEVSKELLRRSADLDLAARLGGDEFVIVVSRLRGSSLADEQRAYEHAIASLSNRLAMPGFHLGATTGGAVLGVDGDTIHELLIAAEAELTAAKAAKPARTSARPGPHHEIRAPEYANIDELIPSWDESPQLQAGIMRRSWGVLTAALVLLASIPLLDSTAVERAAIAAVSLAMLIAFALNRMTDVSVGSSLRSITSYAVYPLVAVIALLAGGADSPALPLLFLLIAYDARDNSDAAMAAKLLLAELVALSTLTYSGGLDEIARQLTLGIVAAIVVMNPILVGLLMRFRRQIEGARNTARELAQRDQLTGVLNRRAFEAAAGAAIASGERCAVVMIDLDNFKAVNTEDGYAGGDSVLASIGRHLTDATRSLDVVGRVGGDEFAALLREVGAIDLNDAAGRFMLAVDRAVGDHGSRAARRVSASCGIAVYPDHGEDLASLMLAADSALMRVKHTGKSAALMPPTSPANY